MVDKHAVSDCVHRSCEPARVTACHCVKLTEVKLRSQLGLRGAVTRHESAGIVRLFCGSKTSAFFSADKFLFSQVFVFAEGRFQNSGNLPQLDLSLTVRSLSQLDLSLSLTVR